MSNPITHCQTFLLLSPITHRFYYEQKSAKYSSKTNLIHLKKQPYWKKINFQLRKNNFPVGKISGFPAGFIRKYGFVKNFDGIRIIFLTEEHYEQSALSFFDKRT